MKKGGLYYIEHPIKDKIYWPSPTERFYNILIDPFPHPCHKFIVLINTKQVEIWINPPPPHTPKPNKI